MNFTSKRPKENDPNVWSGRALQEVFVDLVVSGLASMYPVSSWSCFAPDHHGYQRACVLISREASSGPFGSPVFACADAAPADPVARRSWSPQTSSSGAARFAAKF